jgi:hypothetical protein
MIFGFKIMTIIVCYLQKNYKHSILHPLLFVVVFSKKRLLLFFWVQKKEKKNYFKTLFIFNFLWWKKFIYFREKIF